MEKDLNGFLLFMIRREQSDLDNFVVSKAVLSIFSEWTEFEKILNDQDESKWLYLGEFKEFYKLFKELKHNQSVNFKFKTINLNLKELTGYAKYLSLNTTNERQIE
ncbi:MAG: hypothetical protein IPJ26_19530 [Bacteroidetes bacterium]|nr:hypothetical protein [Bacteroidota bacterium]